ncbi:hypothetical protein AB833_11880 [Chromatiales bacterium (ex Bugula neritina AB1)]|nr:hypothetical protein AB833_11880 [Chromatiales bacterium (ex Bugula neritina AB1)]
MTDITSLINRNRAGEAIGLPCFCTANEHVLRSVFQFTRKHQVPAVIEATCNQVNQEGGYTGMNAADFAVWIKTLAAEYGVPSEHYILGGDHLGPNPWRHLPAEAAMANAEILVREYANAGFRKIHLDASMACGGEPTPSFALVAERAARLCKIAESHSPHPEELFYIIGTEVPIPGGETDAMDDLTVTSVDRLSETIDTHREAFELAGLNHVWPRILSVVTQPGVDFSHTAIHRFEPDKAKALSTALEDIGNMTFEAHSTDYQPTEALAELVAQHFFFLKVGPELTFRMREAVFALANIENHLLTKQNSSKIIATIDHAMDNHSAHWTPYYQGEANLVKHLRHYSYSDRIRYYWSDQGVKAALEKLFTNLSQTKIPETLISQFFSARQFGSLNATPGQLSSDHISLCIHRYYKACGLVT